MIGREPGLWFLGLNQTEHIVMHFYPVISQINSLSIPTTVTAGLPILNNISLVFLNMFIINVLFHKLQQNNNDSNNNKQSSYNCNNIIISEYALTSPLDHSLWNPLQKDCWLFLAE